MLIKCTIAGISPLLCNRFTEASQEKVSNGTTAALTGSRALPREQAEAKVYRNAQGNAVLPSANLLRAIVDAGVFIKAGKSKLSTSRGSLIPAAISIVEPEFAIQPGRWETDSRAVVIPATGGRVMCHRPRFDEWRVSLTLSVDDAMFAEKLVRELVDLAGSRIGVGDFRPARKGPFGRFKVEGWKKK
jgi:hypothetical protein